MICRANMLYLGMVGEFWRKTRLPRGEGSAIRRMGLTGGNPTHPQPRNLAGHPNSPGDFGRFAGKGVREIPGRFGWPPGKFPG